MREAISTRFVRDQSWAISLESQSTAGKLLERHLQLARSIPRSSDSTFGGPAAYGSPLCEDFFQLSSGAMKKIVSTSEAPAAIGPYSQAVRSGSMLFCAGQIPLDPKTGQIVSDDVGEQTRRVLENIAGLLKAAKLSFAHVVKTTIFLTSMGDFQTVNEIYATYFKEDPPARSTVAVAALPKNAKIEIEVIAMASDGGKTVGDTSG